MKSTWPLIVGFSASFFWLPAYRIPMMRQLLDVMDEAVQLPLRIDLHLSSQGEAIESLVVPKIAEDGFNGGKALAIQSFAFVAVDCPFHEIGVALSG